MKEILLINPRKKRKARKKTTKKRTARKTTRRRTVAKRRAPRRTTRKAAPRRNPKRSYSMKRRKTTKKRRATRRNPRRTYKRAISRARNTFAGLNIQSALKDQIPIQLGMFGTKFFAKLFGPEATETDPGSWNWSSYAKGAAGAIAAAFVAQNIKRGYGQKVLQGGFSLITYKLIQNEFVAGNDFMSNHFGIDQDQDDIYIPDEYADLDGYEPGDVEDDEQGNSYLLGDDGQWHLLPESGGAMLGDELRAVGPLGETYERLSPPGALGQVDPVAQALLDN